jgi:hypothetical protein
MVEAGAIFCLSTIHRGQTFTFLAARSLGYVEVVSARYVYLAHGPS